MVLSDPESQSAHVTATGIPIRNLWHMLLYAWGLPHFQERWKSDIEQAPTLDALLAKILANLIQQRMRIGLGRDYCAHASEVAGVRGRVDFNQSLKRMSFEHGKAYCRYSVYSPNVPKNQIVRRTLARLVQVGAFGPDKSPAKQLRTRLRRLVSDLYEVDMIELKSSDIKREMMKRHDSDYALMLAICHLIHLGQMPTEDAGHNQLPAVNRKELKLHDVFEKFVAQFYRLRLTDWYVLPQRPLQWATSVSSKYLPSMRPDIVLKHRVTADRVVIDTKFTAKSLEPGQWGNFRFDSSHVYQMYAYLRSQEHQSEHHQCASGILLYPDAGRSLSECVEIQGHRFWWKTVDLTLPWQEIDEKLLSIPDLVSVTTV